MQAPRNGNLSLVEMSVAGVEDAGVVQRVAWVHWDNVESQIGRLVRLDGDSIVYSLPMELVGRSMRDVFRFSAFEVHILELPRLPDTSGICQQSLLPSWTL